MSHMHFARFAQLSLLIVPLLAVAGCPIDAGTSATVPTGTYWVEYQEGQLAAYVMPTQRGDTGDWVSVPTTAVPAWYTGPALYELHDDLSWERLTTDAGLTLDEVLQTYDAAPAPGEPAASGS